MRIADEKLDMLYQKYVVLKHFLRREGDKVVWCCEGNISFGDFVEWSCRPYSIRQGYTKVV